MSITLQHSDMAVNDCAGPVVRRPPWLKVKLPGGGGYSEIKSLVSKHRLHTVCEEARCPNIGECWSRRTATFMILGDVCTRSCGFCAVKTGRPIGLDLDEPRRVANAAARLNLAHAVITSVNRDEIAGGGASIFAATIGEVRRRLPRCTVEVLIPDFKGDGEALAIVMAARPDILNHNVETVARLYPRVRPQASYPRSLLLLRRAKAAGMATKSGFMVGLGETMDEAKNVLDDLQAEGVDIATVGQYLQPSTEHLEVQRFVTPREFEELRCYGTSIGIRHVEAGPLVRSSYHADMQAARASSNSLNSSNCEGNNY